MDAVQVARVRSFNRIATERAGALRGDFLGRRRPLGEARLLWEIGCDGEDVLRLRARLGLDSAYLSRLLRALETDGLVTVAQSQADARARRARLTTKGEREWRELESRADAFAQDMLHPLSDGQRDMLVEAMQTVERLLTASMVAVSAESPRSAAARWCIGRYFAELQARFDAGFDPAKSTAVGAEALTPPAGVLLVARLRDEPVGCGGLRLHGRAAAEVKRMWVSPAVRGLGVGRRLLRELEEYARAAGATGTCLETNGSLTEAMSLYRSSGYVEVEPFNDEPYAHHWFRKRF
jgi:DNA-binding MarR family transcriptional regulator/GNAT superfamily N-acetyltransferase